MSVNDFVRLSVSLLLCPLCFAGVQMNGFFVDRGVPRFQLLETESKASSGWLAIGSEFMGYKLTQFDPKTGRLSLEKGTESLLLSLKEPQVQAGAAPLTYEERGALSKKIMNNLRQIAAAADQYYLEHGVNTVTLDKLVGEKAYIRKIDVVDGEDYGRLVLKMGTPLKLTSARGLTVEYNP